jgi:hypothetical protein
MKTHNCIYTFGIDRKHECIDFANGYWYPIEDFVRINHLGISEGLYHLSLKNWINDSLFNSIVDFVRKEYPDFDLTDTLKFLNK